MPTRKVPESDRRRCAQACENCKRRKQRCDGRRPCARCIQRGLKLDCQVSLSTHTSRPMVASSLPSPDPESVDRNIGQDLSHAAGTPSLASSPPGTYVNGEQPSSGFLSNALPTRVPQMSRLVKDTKGEYMFIGDSATLSFLQHIRRIVRKRIGGCAFVDDSLRHFIVEVSPERRRGWLMSSAQNPPPQQTVEEVNYLQKWYMRSVNCVLLLFGQQELEDGIREWLDKGGDEGQPASSVYYLVFAIGAQAGPEDKDDLAEIFFNYARYLTVETLMEDPDIITIQAFALITMYLLAASRRNSAFMYLGMAVRAAYALGLHRKNVSSLFTPTQCLTRERLWKAIRILDLFMSASLGRPPSTCETRDTARSEDYSACNDLCMIFECILSDVYAKRMVSTGVVERISKLHRRWSSQCLAGLGLDDIEQDEFIHDKIDGRRPNVGLIHLKQAAYWTIILLSLPFLLKAVSDRAEEAESSCSQHQAAERASSFSHHILVQSCMDSAILTVDLLQNLADAEIIPKRMPFVVNSIFISGLVIGVAIFGNLDTSFPLQRSLCTARSVLRRFARHDPVAKRNLMVLDHLQGACENYMEIRARCKMSHQEYLVGGFFGSVHAIGKSPHRNLPRRQTGEQLFMNPGSSLQNYDSLPLFLESDLALNSTKTADGVAEQPRSDIDSQTQFGMPAIPNFADLTPALSPSMLWFNSFDTMHLFPTVDAHAMESHIMSHEA